VDSYTTIAPFFMCLPTVVLALTQRSKVRLAHLVYRCGNGNHDDTAAASCAGSVVNGEPGCGTQLVAGDLSRRIDMAAVFSTFSALRSNPMVRKVLPNAYRQRQTDVTESDNGDRTHVSAPFFWMVQFSPNPCLLGRDDSWPLFRLGAALDSGRPGSIVILS